MRRVITRGGVMHFFNCKKTNGSACEYRVWLLQLSEKPVCSKCSSAVEIKMELTSKKTNLWVSLIV